ncbi:hypothetical protein D3C80_1626550 [compost metagenome]
MVSSCVNTEFPVFNAELQLGAKLAGVAGTDAMVAEQSSGREEDAFGSVANEIATAEIAARSR